MSRPVRGLRRGRTVAARILLVAIAVVTTASCRPRLAVPARPVAAEASDCPAGTRPSRPPRVVPQSPSTASAWPPAEVFADEAWSLVFHDEFDDGTFTAAVWSTGMQGGARTLEGNGELQWYAPANSVLTTDHDGDASVSVLEQRLRAETVAGEYYTVRTLARLYPPDRCPHLYRPARMAPTDPTRVSLSLHLGHAQQREELRRSGTATSRRG